MWVKKCCRPKRSRLVSVWPPKEQHSTTMVKNYFDQKLSNCLFYRVVLVGRYQMKSLFFIPGPSQSIPSHSIFHPIPSQIQKVFPIRSQVQKVLSHFISLLFWNLLSLQNQAFWVMWSKGFWSPQRGVNYKTLVKVFLRHIIHFLAL